MPQRRIRVGVTDGRTWTEITADHDETVRIRFYVEPDIDDADDDASFTRQVWRDLRVAERSGAASERLNAQLVLIRKHLLVGDFKSALEEVARPKAKRGRPRKLTAWEARRAAAAYRSAIAPGSRNEGQNRRSAVADEFLVPEDTADERIKLARRLGFLPPKGRATKAWASEPRQLLPYACRCGDAYSEHDADGCMLCRCVEYVEARRPSEFEFSRR